MMINAELTRISRNNRTAYELNVVGHARTADESEGSVSVCGAVSCIVQTLESFLTNRGYNHISMAESGNAKVTVMADEPDKRLDNVMLFVAIALEQIAYSEPKWLRAKTFIKDADKTFATL